jgi:sugar lactone lactonase YvrE
MIAVPFVGPELGGGARVILGEGPVVFGDRLLSTDARRCLLRSTDFATGRTVNLDLAAILLRQGLWALDAPTPVLGCVAPTTTSRLLAATSVGLVLLDLATQTVTPFAHPEAERKSLGAYYNDGKAGPDAAFYVGGMTGREGEGRLLRIAADGSVSEPLIDGPALTTPNGMHWFPTDDRNVWDFYYICSNYPAIQHYEHRLLEAKMFRQNDLISLPQERFGYLDGMTGADNGLLFLALYEAPEFGCIVVDRQTGTILDRIETTAPQTTSIALHGDVAYVTSAAQGYTEAEFAASPNAGAVFRCNLGDSTHAKVRECRSAQNWMAGLVARG